MADDALFPPTPAERLARVAMFVSEERRNRVRMHDRHPEKADYWHGRIKQADDALEDLVALAEVL